MHSVCAVTQQHQVLLIPDPRLQHLVTNPGDLTPAGDLAQHFSEGWYRCGDPARELSDVSDTLLGGVLGGTQPQDNLLVTCDRHGPHVRCRLPVDPHLRWPARGTGCDELN